MRRVRTPAARKSAKRSTAVLARLDAWNAEKSSRPPNAPDRWTEANRRFWDDLTGTKYSAGPLAGREVISDLRQLLGPQTPRGRRWCAGNDVELKFLPTYSSWLNRIECEFAANDPTRAPSSTCSPESKSTTY